MRHNEQPPPSPAEIARLTAESRAGWTAKEEYERRVVKGYRPVVVPSIQLPNANDHINHAA